MHEKEKVIRQPSSRIIALQHISYALTKAYFVISRSRVTATADWTVSPANAHVIASTHVSWLDPFIATTALGWKRLRPLLPCRFMAAPVFMEKPALQKLMLWLGAFPSHQLQGLAYGLDASKTLLDKQQAVVIFPQGKRTTDTRVHRGVAELARHPRTLVVPVLIKRNGRFLGLQSYRIYTGEPFDGSQSSAEEIMARVFELEDRTLWHNKAYDKNSYY